MRNTNYTGYIELKVAWDIKWTKKVTGGTLASLYSTTQVAKEPGPKFGNAYKISYRCLVETRERSMWGCERLLVHKTYRREN